MIAAHDRAESWKEDGATSMAAWLAAQLGVGHGTAAQLVSVGESLETLPTIADAFGEGRLSWDKVRSLTRFAGPDDEAALADEAQGLSASQVHTLARRLRAPEGSEKDRTKRSLRKWWDQDRQWLNLHGRIPGAEGAAVEKALDRVANQVPQNAEHQVFEDPDVRLADALVEIASIALATDPDPDRANVVVHVDVETLTTGDGVGEIETGPTISADTARRLSCDSRLQTVLDGTNGLPVGIGRTSRTIPAWLNRQIRNRDRGCRFPVANAPAGPKLIIWFIGPRVARPTSTTSPPCAATTTAWSTSQDGQSKGALTGIWSSSDPTVRPTNPDPNRCDEKFAREWSIRC